MRILLPYSGVSVTLFYLTLGSPLASSHHSLRKICQDISYSREQETWHLYILICSLHGCILVRPLNIACEYWPVQKQSNTKLQHSNEHLMCLLEKLADIKVKYVSSNFSCPFFALIFCLYMSILHMLIEKSGGEVYF